jgi:hypothetical protein
MWQKKKGARTETPPPDALIEMKIPADLVLMFVEYGDAPRWPKRLAYPAREARIPCVFKRRATP